MKKQVLRVSIILMSLLVFMFNSCFAESNNNKKSGEADSLIGTWAIDTFSCWIGVDRPMTLFIDSMLAMGYDEDTAEQMKNTRIIVDCEQITISMGGESGSVPFDIDSITFPYSLDQIAPGYYLDFDKANQNMFLAIQLWNDYLIFRFKRISAETASGTDKKEETINIAPQSTNNSVVLSTSNYTIHNGTKFGMTKEEVKRLESLSGFSLEADEYSFGNTAGASVLKGSGKIAGIEDSTVRYVFSQEGKLYSCFYNLGSPYDYKQTDYDTVEKALAIKYGDPDNIYLSITSKVDYEPINNILSLFTDHKLPSSANLTSWLIPIDDNNNCVVILHCAIKAELLPTYYITLHMVGYQIYSSSYIADILNTVQMNINDSQKQLDEDL